MGKSDYESAEEMNFIAGTCLEKGDYKEALEKFNHALDLLPEGMIQAKAQLHSNRGHALVNLLRHQDALSSFKQAADIFESLDERINQGEQLGNVGSVYRDMERWDDSLDTYFKSLKIFKEAGHKGGMADQYSNIGYSYTRKGDLKKALEFFGEAKTLYDELGNVEKAKLCDQNLQAIQPYLK